MTDGDREFLESTEPPPPDKGEGGPPSLLARLTRPLIFVDPHPKAQPLTQPSRYRRMWRNTVITVTAVSLLPLVVMTLVNYFLYRRSFREEMLEPVERVAALSQRSVELFLNERISAGRFVLSRESVESLYEEDDLERIFNLMQQTFGGIVDVGVIDSNGTMRAYAGPYKLRHKSYRDQEWFNQMRENDVHVSNAFLGHRKLPHIVVAVKRSEEGCSDECSNRILRATIDTKVLNEQISVTGRLRETADAFIIDRRGILQTPSRLFGPPLSQFPGEVPPPAEGARVLEDFEISGTSYVMAYAYVQQSPFVIMILASRRDLARGWLTYQTEIVGLLLASMIAIVLIIMGITSNWVGRIRIYELRREATLHKVEHSNKMASIGRLASGVSHEINNPLAIINEKAGLMRDIIEVTEGVPRAEKMLNLIDSIISSVTRCKNITHRLLGFARHIDFMEEPVAVDGVIRDVLAFLEKEAAYMRVTIMLCIQEPVPTIYSDKGQLQQLLLNLINNALDAVERDGHIAVDVSASNNDVVEVAVMDDGSGISKEHLDRIFEPFFSTKRNKGTGLGLSICYGIVRKLRGTMKVESEVGIGTTFVIQLPVHRPEGGGGSDTRSDARAAS